jgi:hypothetical protein
VELFVTGDEAVRRFRRRAEDTDLNEESVRERAEAFPYSALAHRLGSAGATPPELARDVTEWLAEEPPAIDPMLWAAAGREWS